MFEGNFHEAVIYEDDFSKVQANKLRNDTSDVGSVEERFGGFNDAINECGGMGDGITSDLVFDVLKIVCSAPLVVTSSGSFLISSNASALAFAMRAASPASRLEVNSYLCGGRTHLCRGG